MGRVLVGNLRGPAGPQGPPGSGDGGTTITRGVNRTITPTASITPTISHPENVTASVEAVITPGSSIGAVLVGTSPAGSPITEVAGSTVTVNQYQTTTLAVNPSLVGNLMLLVCGGGAAALADTTVSGGGVTDWVRATGLEYDVDGTPRAQIEIWTGVITAAGSADIVVDNPGMNYWPTFFAREYTSAGNDLEWSVIQAEPSSPTVQDSPSYSAVGSHIALPSDLDAGSYIGAAVAEWGKFTGGVAITGVSYNVAANGTGVAEYLNGPANVAPVLIDNNTGDVVMTAAILLQATTQSVNLAIEIPTEIPVGTETEPYTLSFSGTGGSGTGYLFGIFAGALPAGLTMDTAGNITGNLTAAGTSTFSVILRDSVGNQTISKDVSIKVVALPPIVFTRTFPTDSDAAHADYLPSFVTPGLFLEGTGPTSEANISMNMWGPVAGEVATLNVYSVKEWDFLCKVNNPSGSVTCFPNSASWLINLTNWYDFSYFLSGWDEVMEGTPEDPQGIIASACYDNWFTNTLVGPTGFAVNEIMCHFDERNRGSGPYAATVVPFGGYTVDTPNGPIDVPLRYWSIAYSNTTLYFIQVDAAGTIASTPTGIVDWKAFFQWCVDHGYLDPAAPMWGFGMGFEVCHTGTVQRKFRYNDMWWAGGL